MVHWGAERVGVRWGIPERLPAPTSPSQSLSRLGPSLSPLKGGEGLAQLPMPRRSGRRRRCCNMLAAHRQRDTMRGADRSQRAGALRAKLAATLTFSRYALHRFNRDGCFAASSGLSYMTLVSLVPLGVIALGILSIFPNFAGPRQQLLEFVFRNFVPQISEQAAWWFQYLAESAGQATAIGIIGIAASGILLLITVE